MPVPGQIHSLGETLERIRLLSEVSEAEWLAKLQVTSNEYLDIAAGTIAPSALMVERVAEAYDLSFENLYAGKIDFSALNVKKGGTLSVLPERYRVGAQSRIRTSRHLLGYVEKFHGWRIRQRILRNFQLSEAIVGEADKLINILFLKDLCDWIIHNNGGKELLYSMGQYSLVANKQTSLGKMLEVHDSNLELHEKVFGEVVKTHFDQNATYTIQKISEKGCSIRVVPKSDVLDRIQPVLRTGEKRLGSQWVCTARAGSFSSLSGYINRPFSSVRETRCIHRGDSHCLYEFEFVEFARKTVLSQ